MSNEAQISCGIQIIKGNLKYRPPASSFRGDVEGTNGPSPGALVVPTTGVNVSFAELTTPGYCRVCNLDVDNYVIWGVHDGVNFYPIGEILPGEFYIHRFYRSFGGVGTGTGSAISYHLRATVASCNVTVEAFEA